MADRILDISERPARLSVNLGQLIARFDDDTTRSLPLEDTAVLVVGNRMVTYTHAMLSALMEHRAVLVLCNERMLPVGMAVPLPNHSLQGKRALQQAAASLPTMKRLWQQVVRAKIGGQAACLDATGGDGDPVRCLEEQVRSGDASNIEARAARMYWSRLFPEPKFVRVPDGPPPNHLLNYGYTVLRAITARALCGSGLYPALGIHHHHRNNAFPLADDLMEPFRPLVDITVWKLCEEHGRDAALTPETKAALISPLAQRIKLGRDDRTLFDILARLASSLANVFGGSRKKLDLPKPSDVIDPS